MRSLRKAVVAVVLVLGLAAGAAYADQTIYAGPPNQFVGGDITMAQGEKLTFSNVDTTTHDVTAKAAGPDGKPLFASAKTGPGQSSPVEGAEYLTTGHYDYICSIHPFMTGTITVTTDGTPAQRPGSGSPPPSGQPPAPSSDTTPPSVSVKVLDTKRSKIRKRRSLQVSATVDEPATIGFTARSGRTTVANGTARFEQAGTRKVSLKLTKAGLRLAKRSRRLHVVVEARAADAANNSSTAAANGSLR
jgi:plastocyanin